MILILKILVVMNFFFFLEINNLCLLFIKLLLIMYKLIFEVNLVFNFGFIYIYMIELVNKIRLFYFNIKMVFFYVEYECFLCYLYIVIMYYILM